MTGSMHLLIDAYVTFKEYFWSHKFWLNSNVTWDDIVPVNSSIYYPKTSDLLTSVYMAILLGILRYCIEKYLFFPVGRHFGLKETKSRLKPNPILESFYQTSSRPDRSAILNLAKRCDLTERQIERWLLIRRECNKPSTMVKFCESGWRFIFYSCLFFYGLYILWDKPWLWETRLSWVGHPFQHVTDDIYWYYMIEYGYYLTALVSLFKDVKRKDFTEMVVHHFATLLLMTFSWICNYVRIGSVILMVHDAVDYWMELAKMVNYLKKCLILRDICFVVFLLLWVVTRMTIYPFWCLRSMLFETRPNGVDNYCYYFFASLLILLQILHVIWFYFILKIVQDAYFKGEKMKDSRSDSDGSGDDAILDASYMKH